MRLWVNCICWSNDNIWPHVCQTVKKCFKTNAWRRSLYLAMTADGMACIVSDVIQTEQQYMRVTSVDIDTGWFSGLRSVNTFLSGFVVTGLLAARVAFLRHRVSRTVTLLQTMFDTHRLSTHLRRHRDTEGRWPLTSCKLWACFVAKDSVIL